MAKTIQFKRGTTTQTNAYTGALGEITIDTDKDVPVVHTGAQAGGFAVAARANVDGSVSIIARDGTILSTLHAGTKLVEYTPIPYPLTTPPTGYIMLMGQGILQATYPILYSLYGATLPDMRAGFIRGWDNGKGIDTGRTILSLQDFAIENITGSIGSVRTTTTSPPLTGAFYLDGGASGSITGATGTIYQSVGFDASRVVNTAAETRPRNIAFNYIVKAG